MRTMFTLWCLVLTAGIAGAQGTFQTKITAKKDPYYSYSLVPAGDGGSYMVGGKQDCRGATCKNVVFAHHFNTQGKLVWTRSYQPDLSPSGVVALAAKDGGFLFLGRLDNDTATPKYQGALLAKCNAGGDMVWKKQLTSKSYPYYVPLMIREDNDGNVLVVNQVNNTGNPYYNGLIQVVKLNTKGKIVWSRTLGGAGGFYDDNYRLDGFNQIGNRYYLTGSGSAEIFEGQAVGDLIVMDTSGKVLMAREVSQDPLEYYDGATAAGIFVKKGQAYLLGTYLDNSGDNPLFRYFLVPVNDTTITAAGTGFNISPLSLKYQLRDFKITYPFRVNGLTYFTRRQTLMQLVQTGENKNFTLSRYDSLNRICPNYVQPATDTTSVKQNFFLNPVSFDVLADPVYLTDIGMVTINDSATYTIQCQGNAPDNERVAPAVTAVKTAERQLYPNPVKDRMQLTGMKAGSEVLVYDAAGRLVKHVVATGETMAVYVNGLKSGVYFVKVREKTLVVWSSRMIKE